MRARTAAIAAVVGGATLWALWPKGGLLGGPAPAQGGLPPWVSFRGVPLPPADAARYNAAGKAWIDGRTAKDREEARQTLVQFAPAILAGFEARKAVAEGSADYYVREHVKWYRESDLTMANFNGQVTDQFGVYFEGTPSNLFATFGAVAGYALPYVPGIGSGAAFALGAALAIAQGKSAKDAALAGARMATPMPARIAFDAGVAVASGQSIDTATKGALMKQIPGGSEAFERGRVAALAKGGAQ